MTPTPQPLPPTPTLLPPGTPFFEIPRSVSIWSAAPYAVQSWNELGSARTIIQVIVLVAILIAVAYVLMRFGKDFTSGGGEA